MHRLCHFIHLLRVLYQLVHYMRHHFPSHEQPQEKNNKENKENPIFLKTKLSLVPFWCVSLATPFNFQPLDFAHQWEEQQFF